VCFFVPREKNGETAAKKRRTFLPKSAPFFLHYSNSKPDTRIIIIIVVDIDIDIEIEA
jgi:hypothetical protein